MHQSKPFHLLSPDEPALELRAHRTDGLGLRLHGMGMEPVPAGRKDLGSERKGRSGRRQRQEGRSTGSPGCWTCSNVFGSGVCDGGWLARDGCKQRGLSGYFFLGPLWAFSLTKQLLHWSCTFGGLQEPGGQLQLVGGEDSVLVTCRQRQGYVLQWARIWGWGLVDWCLSRLHELDV